MPRIFDNIEQDLLHALRDTLNVSDRDFYAEMCRIERWSIHTLLPSRNLLQKKLLEAIRIAREQITARQMNILYEAITNAIYANAKKIVIRCRIQVFPFWNILQQMVKGAEDERNLACCF